MAKIEINLDSDVLIALNEVCNRTCISVDEIVNAILRNNLVRKIGAFDLHDNHNIETTNKTLGLSNVGSMSKAIVVRKLSVWYPSMSNSNTTFSSKNSSSNTYWANPNVELLNKDWYIILNDTKSKKLYLFLVPAYAIKLSELVVRADNRRLIDLQIDFYDKTFRDTRSNYRFGKYLKRVFTY